MDVEGNDGCEFLVINYHVWN